jgi:hypothetical protein
MTRRGRVPRASVADPWLDDSAVLAARFDTVDHRTIPQQVVSAAGTGYRTLALAEDHLGSMTA